MKPVRARHVVLICAAMAASSILYAQARGPVPKAPRIEPRIEREKEALPCGIAWESCLATPRSRAAAIAWSRGLDEQGAPLDTGARARKFAAMESWLRRLAGIFRIAGTYRNHGGLSQIGGTVKCSLVGSGPGVSCAITAVWKPPRESNKDPEFDKALQGAMQSLVILFGIDPDASNIRATMLDYRALKMRAFLMDDQAAFSGEAIETSSSNHLVPYNLVSSLVAITPDGDVNMTFVAFPTSAGHLVTIAGMPRGEGLSDAWIELNMRLHRENPATGHADK